ncbi:MAG: hypothetical protein ACRDOM_04060, partial [Nocardioides sp.]
SGAWDRLRDEVSAWPGDCVISMEWLCAADAAHIRRILEGLHPASVHVVFTARDLGRTLPAAWQEYMQTRQEWTWEEFLEAVSSADPADHAAGRAFWAQQDLPALVERWSVEVGADHVHLVTLPHPGSAPDVLWQRVAQVLEIDPEGYRTDDIGGNQSLGLESAELMRRLNPTTRTAGLSKALYQRMFKHGLAKHSLARRRGAESALGLPEQYHDWARKTATRHIEAIRHSGVRVIGDLDELEPILIAGRQPSDVEDHLLLDAALTGLVSLAQLWHREKQEQAKLTKRNTRLQRRVARLEKRVATLSGRVQRFESKPLRSGLRLTARHYRRGARKAVSAAPGRGTGARRSGRAGR